MYSSAALARSAVSLPTNCLTAGCPLLSTQPSQLSKEGTLYSLTCMLELEDRLFPRSMLLLDRLFILP